MNKNEKDNILYFNKEIDHLIDDMMNRLIFLGKGIELTYDERRLELYAKIEETEHWIHFLREKQKYLRKSIKKGGNKNEN